MMVALQGLQRHQDTRGDHGVARGDAEGRLEVEAAHALVTQGGWQMLVHGIDIDLQACLKLNQFISLHSAQAHSKSKHIFPDCLTGVRLVIQCYFFDVLPGQERAAREIPGEPCRPKPQMDCQPARGQQPCWHAQR